MLAALEAGVATYAETLKTFLPYLDAIGAIAVRGDGAGAEPVFDNAFLCGGDAIALYGMLASQRPRRYIEVGSGNSTKFARRCIRDQQLSTHVTSIDPAPRAVINELCDVVLRQPVEDVDLALFDALESGDVLFIDNSHRCFMNSDVTVCFLDILPRLRPGVFVHLHDIFWPADYPADWSKRYYNEQYLLGALLAGGWSQYEVVLPVAFAASRPELTALLDPLWHAHPEFATVPRDGGSFWLRRTTA